MGNRVSFSRNRVSFYRNRASFYRNRVFFHRNKVFFHRNMVSFYRNKVSFYRNRVSFYWNRVSFYRNRVSFYRNRVSFFRNRVSFYKNRVSIFRNRVSFLWETVFLVPLYYTIKIIPKWYPMVSEGGYMRELGGVCVVYQQSTQMIRFHANKPCQTKLSLSPHTSATTQGAVVAEQNMSSKLYPAEIWKSF